MAKVEDKGGYLLVTPGEGEDPYASFWFGGSFYYYRKKDGKWIRQYQDARGLTKYQFANVRIFNSFTFNLPEIPEALNLQPAIVWPDPGAGIAASYFIDARRLVRTVAYVDRQDGLLEVPLIDDDGVPWLGTSCPPMMMIRRCVSSTYGDKVEAPNTADVKWKDSNCFVRPVGAYALPSGGQHTFGAQDHVYVSLVVRTDPQPHWAIRIATSSLTASGANNVLVDLIGEGYGAHAAAQRTDGSASTHGHFETTLMWQQQGFLSATSASVLNDRKMGRGAADVANSMPEVSSTPGQLFLTTGASAGGSGGTALFTDLPMVMVLGSETLGSYITHSPTTNWDPGSIGMGCQGTTSDAQTSSDTTKNYYTELYLDSASSKHVVDIYNIGNDGSGLSGSSRDRTFFVFSAGV
jgi:hypothetical protein